MLYGIRSCSDPAVAYLSAITYWVFSCRDRNTTPAKGLDKWSFLGSAIEQSAVKSQSVDDYISLLAAKLKAPAPHPARWHKMIAHEENERIPVFATRTEFGLSDILEPAPGSPMPAAVSPMDVLQDVLAKGVRERQIIQVAKPVRLGGKPFVVVCHCQVADQIFGYQPMASDENEIIEAEAAIA